MRKRIEMIRITLVAICVVWAANTSSPADAATLTTVPMQGSMVMSMVSYNAVDGTLHVNVEATAPQLTPLLISNPGDCFSLIDPWYDFLDPSRQGLAFSRRYGFVMDVASDPLPAGTSLWLRNLSSSPGLSAYHYRSSEPKLWDPIFGTAGSTNALQWDGSMFHPGFTAPPGTGTYTASFEAFLLNTSTGEPVAGAKSEQFTFAWTALADGRPALCVASKVVVTWPASASNCVLEANDTLSGSNWTAVTNSPVLLDGLPGVVLDPSQTHKFFRIRIGP